MSADAQLAAYVDRVLRMKEEADGIAEDIKAIYGEAKAEGYDKTQLGNLVTYLRKRAKDKDGEAEKEAVFDLYLSAYMRAKGEVGTTTDVLTHTHAREEDGGQIRRMVKARQEIFEALENEGKIPGRDTGRSVYFLYAEAAGLLKIGSSDDVRSRVRSLSGASPVKLRLLGVIGGGTKREIELHQQFGPRRSHGEWFTVDDEFLDQVQDIVATRAHAPDDEITEPQVAPQPAQGSDEAAEPVACRPIQPETVNHEGEAQKVERRSPKPEDAGSIPATFANAGSSNGRTAEFDSANAGSTPAPASTVTAFTAKPLRPYCLNPGTKCGGQGKKHCGKCEQAHQQAQAGNVA